MKTTFKTPLLIGASVLAISAVLVRTASAQSNVPSARSTATSVQIAPKVTGSSSLSAQTPVPVGPDTDPEQADDQSGPDTPDANEAQGGADTDTEQADNGR